MTSTTKLNLSFTPQELDYIANVLAERPWKETNALMVNIQQQIMYQQQPPAPTDVEMAPRPNGAAHATQ